MWRVNMISFKGKADATVLFDGDVDFDGKLVKDSWLSIEKLKQLLIDNNMEIAVNGKYITKVELVDVDYGIANSKYINLVTKEE